MVNGPFLPHTLSSPQNTAAPGVGGELFCDSGHTPSHPGIRLIINVTSNAYPSPRGGRHQTLGNVSMDRQGICAAELRSSGACITSPLSSSLVSAAAPLTSEPLTVCGTTCHSTFGPRAFSTLRCLTPGAASSQVRWELVGEGPSLLCFWSSGPLRSIPLCWLSLSLSLSPPTLTAAHCNPYFPSKLPPQPLLHDLLGRISTKTELCLAHIGPQQT